MSSICRCPECWTCALIKRWVCCLLLKLHSQCNHASTYHRPAPNVDSIKLVLVPLCGGLTHSIRQAHTGVIGNRPICVLLSGGSFVYLKFQSCPQALASLCLECGSFFTKHVTLQRFGFPSPTYIAPPGYPLIIYLHYTVCTSFLTCHFVFLKLFLSFITSNLSA